MAKKIAVTGGSGGGSFVVRELLDAVFPGVPVAKQMGVYESMVGSRKATRLLGWKAGYTWRGFLRYSDSPAGSPPEGKTHGP